MGGSVSVDARASLEDVFSLRRVRRDAWILIDATKSDRVMHHMALRVGRRRVQQPALLRRWGGSSYVTAEA